MRSRHTGAGLLARLERLENRVIAAQPLILRVRFGHLRRLPSDYEGERHVVITKQLPNRGDQEWVEYQEMPGPAPQGPEELNGARVRRINIMFVDSRPKVAGSQA